LYFEREEIEKKESPVADLCVFTGRSSENPSAIY
jgi:hypothetical protein